MAKLIAQTYGQALYELAAEKNSKQELLSEAGTLRAVFSDGDEFMRFMKNPRITPEEKQEVIETSLKGRISSDMLGFLVVLNQKERFSEIDSILEYFIEKVRLSDGIGRARVSSALPLSMTQRTAVREKLLATTGYKEMDIDYETDPSLLGGIVIRVGDRVVDGSIRTRLYELKRELSQVRV